MLGWVVVGRSGGRKLVERTGVKPPAAQAASFRYSVTGFLVDFKIKVLKKSTKTDITLGKLPFKI